MDTSLTKLAAAFTFLSLLTIVATLVISFASGLGGPVPLDFAAAESLRHMQDSRPAILWTEALALAGPALALGAGLGWHRLLRSAGAYVALGVLLWYAGMIFVITQDALEYVLVARLPSLYFAADGAARTAIAALGSSLGGFIETLTLVGDGVSNVGILLVCIAMWRGVRGVPKWLGAIGMVAAILIVLGLVGATAALAGPWGAVRAIGFLVFTVWLAATGIVMLRWRPQPADAV